MMTYFLDSSVWLTMLQEATAKGLIVLLAAGVCTLLLRRAAAATRHLIWCVALSGLVLLPVLSMILPSWPVPILPRFSAMTGPVTTLATPALETLETISTDEPSNMNATSAMASASISSEASLSPASWSWTVWMCVVWLSGVLVILTRLGFGLVRIWWVTRRASLIHETDWMTCSQHIHRQIGLDRRPPLYFSQHINMPLTWGTLHPVVVVPTNALDWSAERRQIVLTHEFAHIKRRDCLTQLFVQMACAVYWFNPLVWLAARQHRIERERACDDQVLDTGAKASSYADHLLGMARAFRTPEFDSFATVAFARPSQLEGRLLSILDPHISRRRVTPFAVRLAVIGISCAIVPLAVLQPTAQALPTEGIDRQEGEPVEPPSSRIIDDKSNDRPATTTTSETRINRDLTRSASRVNRALARFASRINRNLIQSIVASAKAVTFEDEFEDRNREDTSDVLEGLAAIGYDNLTIDQLISFKTHGVTPGYIKQVKALGYEDVSIPQLLAFRIHGVTAAYIGQMNAAFDDRIPADKLVAARIHNVSPDMIRDVHAAFDEDLSLEDMIAFRIHGVTPALLDDLAEAGFTDLTPEDLTAVKIHGVTPVFIQDIRASGVENLDMEDLVAFRINGVTPELVEEMGMFGFTHLSPGDLTSIKIHGATPAFIREIHSMGYEDMDLQDFISFRIHGITPEYMEKVRDRGFDDLSARELIALKKAGIIRD